jgi:glycosyltransferase involved in cell wall biosynthesis
MAAALETFCLKRTYGVVAISSYTEELVKDLTPKTWLLPNAVDRRFFDVTPETQAVPRILFVGSIDERKNPLGLLRACAPLLWLGECTLTYAGQANASSPYVQEFFKEAAEIPGVELLGFIGRDELGAQFGRSTLLVLPTFEDNCPMVILEAMAAGLPVAASRVGGVPDLITHEKDGLMFDPNHPSEMKTSIERLVKEPDTRARLGAAGRNTAREHFHPTVIAAAHLEIYQEILGR